MCINRVTGTVTRFGISLSQQFQENAVGFDVFRRVTAACKGPTACSPPYRETN
jgi:hypothetical protein